MSKLHEIKRRIKSVNNISQVTKAMQMVAASRMKKAQENAQRGTFFTGRIRELMVKLASHQTTAEHPLLDPSHAMSPDALLIVYSTQRGLAGSLPGNLYRFTMQRIKQLEDQGKTVHVITIGRKVADQLARRGAQVIADFSSVPEEPTTADIRPLMRLVQDQYLGSSVGIVEIVYPVFVNALTQVTTLKQVLPVEITPEEIEAGEKKNSVDFVYEPSASAILDAIVPRYLETQLYQARLETVASEYSARMVAMKNATDNAKDVKYSLTLEYNKSRQTQITAEIAEITSGRMKTL